MAIVAENLLKVFNGKKVAVDNLSLSIRYGEVFGLLGPNGAGKSTLVKLITGILRPNGGKLQVLGQLVPDNIKYIREKIGYVPQELVFYEHLTVRENLNLFCRAYEVKNRDKRIDEVLNLTKLEELSDRVSSDMSGGQKRRLNLGMGMLHQPELLILDEPSAGMDPQSRNILWNTIEDLGKDEITIILTTHLMETADRLSDRIAIIDHGKLNTIDTPTNLKTKHGDGDVIEINFHDTVSDDMILKSYNLLTEGYHVVKYDHTLAVTALDAVNLLPDLIAMIAGEIGRDKIRQISMRDNTLEDVFIQLTGHTLRE